MGVMVKNKVARFLWTTVYFCPLLTRRNRCEYTDLEVMSELRSGLSNVDDCAATKRESVSMSSDGDMARCDSVTVDVQ